MLRQFQLEAKFRRQKKPRVSVVCMSAIKLDRFLANQPNSSSQQVENQRLSPVIARSLSCQSQSQPALQADQVRHQVGPMFRRDSTGCVLVESSARRFVIRLKTENQADPSEAFPYGVSRPPFFLYLFDSSLLQHR